MAEPVTAAVGAMSVFMLLFILFWLVIIAGIIFSMILWIWMLVDAVKRNFPSENDKVIWIIVIVLAGIIGAIIYYFVVKRKGSTSPPPKKKK